MDKLFWLKDSPWKFGGANKGNQVPQVSSITNPFNRDDESEHEKKQGDVGKASILTSSVQSQSLNPFDVGEERSDSSASYSHTSYPRSNYKNGFRDDGGLENQPVQELENYAVYKAEKTTKVVDDCLKIAEEMREGATNTLVTLHGQGEQITHMHNSAVEMDHDLSRGEKLLGSLGGMFSRTWKPKKTRSIMGPIATKDSLSNKVSHMEQKRMLVPSGASKGQNQAKKPPPEPLGMLQKVELEKSKQDDALSDLSNILVELKGMAVDMGTEIERQTTALDHLQDDVEELNYRVKGANQRGRRLLGK